MLAKAKLLAVLAQRIQSRREIRMVVVHVLENGFDGFVGFESGGAVPRVRVSQVASVQLYATLCQHAKPRSMDQRL